MREKSARGVLIASLGLTMLSLMFFVGLMVYNIRRVFLADEGDTLAIIVTVLLVLIAVTLVVSIVIYSFLSFITDLEIESKQYAKVLYLMIVFKLLTYVFFSLSDYSIPGSGILGEVHYLTYIFSYRSDLMPTTTFVDGGIQFIHSLMTTDVLSLGAVLVGLSLYDKYRYAPMFGAIFGIIINLVFISVINVRTVNEYGVDFLYYKVDAVFATLILEFAMLGYVMYRLYYDGQSEKQLQK